MNRNVDDEQSYTFTGLSPSTTYTITLIGIPASGVDDVIVPSSVDCTTKGMLYNNNGKKIFIPAVVCGQNIPRERRNEGVLRIIIVDYDVTI